MDNKLEAQKIRDEALNAFNKKDHYLCRDLLRKAWKLDNQDFRTFSQCLTNYVYLFDNQ